MTDLSDTPTPAAQVSAPPPLHPELPDGVEPGGRVPRWRPWTAFAAMVIGFVGASIGFVVIASIATAFGFSFEDPPPGVTISATVVQNLLLIGASIYFAGRVARPLPWHFGLRRPAWWSSVGWTVLAFVTFLAFSAIWVSALGLENEEDTLPAELGVDESTVALIAVAFLVTVVAPIGEELFFRGFYFRALANWKGIWPAAIITGITFGSIHAGGSPIGFLVPLGVFGMVLCLLYVKTQSLYPPIVLHAINNSLAFGATQDWTWEIPVVLASSLAIITLGAWAVRRSWGPAPARPLPV